MSAQDYEQLTLFREDFPASRSVLPGSEEARTMTVTSGRKCLELYGNSSPLGSLVRMCLESSIWHSTRCLLRWKVKVTKSKRSLFQLAVSMPRTKETVSPLWPTATTDSATERTRKYQQGGMPLALAVKLWPTPTANDGPNSSFPKSQINRHDSIAKRFLEMAKENGLEKPNGSLAPEFVEWLMGYEAKFTELIPTVTTTDGRTNALSRYWRPSSQTVHVERGGRGPVSESVDRAGRGHTVWENWPAEPDVGRVANGIPNRVDRIKCLGNAVVPQQFYPIFKAIYEVERDLT